MEEIKNNIINELEKWQGGVSTEVEGLIADGIDYSFQNENFADGYEKGLWQGFEKAIEVVAETIDFLNAINNREEK